MQINNRIRLTARQQLAVYSPLCHLGIFSRKYFLQVFIRVITKKNCFREELINRLRERAMIGGFAPPSGLDLSSLFPNFAKLNSNNSSTAVIDASGDGNNNHTNGGTSGLNDVSMLDGDEINCEDGEDGMMAEIDYGDSIEGSEDGLSIENQISPQRRCSTDSGKKEESYMNSTSITMVPIKTETPQLQMPILRSAISASPLNSLMYHKKLSNALRNKQRVDHHHHSMMANFLNPNFNMSSPQSEYVPSPVPPQTVVRASISPQPATRVKEERCTPPSRPVINVLRDIPDCTPSIDSHISPTDSASSNSSAHSTCCPSSTPPADAKSGPCFHCQLMKGKLAQAENRCRFLESRTTSQESKISRLENRVSTLESNNRRYETEAVSLRDHCENLERKILECQERALKYLTNNNFDADTTKKILHDLLETCRVYKPC